MNKMLFVKMLAVSLLTGVILIALAFVHGVLEGRESYREEAVKSIAQSYAGAQRLTGPVLVQPYSQIIEDVTVGDKGERRVSTRKSEGTLWVFPKSLNLRGDLRPNERHHGLYKVTVYEVETHLEGTVSMPPRNLPGQVTYGAPYLAMSLTDVRGIVGSPAMQNDGQPVAITGIADQRAGNWKPNLQAAFPEALIISGRTISFALNLTLGGTQALDIAPVASANHIELSSSWPSPLFAGQFLPRSREVSPNGFHAVWEISSLAAATQNQMNTDQAANADAIEVSLLNPIDPYKLSDRAVKYGILFVLLTFSGFFLLEIVKQLQIHPIQYLLVGFGLAIFFLLLVSLSEHIAFATSYFLASVACIGLLTYYLCFVLRSVVYGSWFGVLLTLLYASIYGLLISEDNALLLGSGLLFVLLGAIMVTTRRVDWYRQSGGLTQAKTGQGTSVPPPPLPMERIV